MRVLSDRYELTAVLGRGGMGEVHRATDRVLRRTVAVKLLPAELSGQKVSRARFEREARAAAGLNHPNIATLHDVGTDLSGNTPSPYLVMEYVEGRMLTELLDDGPLPVERVSAIVRDLLGALAHSHAHGVVHRDIKPGNLMVTTSGTVKVLDFGIAQALADTATRLTATGAAIGTPGYLSPEQIRGDPVDGRADLYSAGCLLYELLTGRPPFTGDSPFVVMHHHLARTPAVPSTLRRGIAARLDGVVLRALAKDPDDRFPDADTMREALERADAAAGPADAVPQRPADPRLPAAAPVPVPAAAPGQPVAAPVAAADAPPHPGPRDAAGPPEPPGRPPAVAPSARIPAPKRPAAPPPAAPREPGAPARPDPVLVRALAVGGCVISLLLAYQRPDIHAVAGLIAGIAAVVCALRAPSFAVALGWAPFVNFVAGPYGSGFAEPSTTVAVLLLMTALCAATAVAYTRGSLPRTLTMATLWFLVHSTTTAWLTYSYDAWPGEDILHLEHYGTLVLLSVLAGTVEIRARRAAPAH
jgi:eukaryotic-like serine/threonine-protein kinase